MSIPLHDLANSFADALCKAPNADLYAQMYRLDDILRAGAQLQRMAERLAPLVKGDAAVSDESLTKLVERYQKNYALPPTHQEKESLERLFSRYLYENVPGRFRPEGIAQLAPAMGKTVEELLKKAEDGGKVIQGRVFASVENVGLGCSHLFTFKPGVNGRNARAGLLAYAGAAACLHGGKRAVIGSPDSIDDRKMVHHWVSSGAECLAGLATIAAALKLAEKNIRSLN